MSSGPAASDGVAAVLDAASLQQLRALDPQGGSGFVLRVLSTYLRSLARGVDGVAAAHPIGDLQALAQAAHALKSASASVGALELARLCAALEDSIRQGLTSDLPQTVTSFDTEAGRVRLAVQALVDGGLS